MGHHVAVDPTAPGRLDGLPVQPMAGGAHGTRRMLETTTARAALDEQLALLHPLPEERVVVGARRAGTRAHLLGGLRLPCRPLGRAELEQPELHAAHLLSLLVPVDHDLAHEVPGPQRRALELRDGFDRRRRAEQVAGAEVPPVLLTTVGGHHRGEAGLVEQLQHRAHGPHRGRRRIGQPQPRHRPRLHHGGRSHQPTVDGALGKRRIRVDGVGVLHRVAPVADHGRIDRVPGDLGLRRLPDVGSETREQLVATGPAHRAARGRPRPRVATISRWISFTPPPNVLI